MDYTLSIFDLFRAVLELRPVRHLANGIRFAFPPFCLACRMIWLTRPTTAFADAFEHVVGRILEKPIPMATAPERWPEIEQGTNPLDGVPAANGLVASIKLPGNAVDICATDDLAVLALKKEALPSVISSAA